MTAHDRPLADYIEIRGRFRRSIHLEKDFSAASQNGDYLITPTARDALRRLLEGIEERSTCRAWTLTGPYGVGKSAFAVFLSRLLCENSAQGKQARRQLTQADPLLSDQFQRLGLFKNGTRGFLPVLVTARRIAASKSLAEGIVNAAKESNSRGIQTAVRSLKSALSQPNGNHWDSRQIVTALDSMSKAAQSAKYNGVVLILDEMGKLFEYAARYPQRGDVFVLQELAEQAARSNQSPILFIGLLHQSFEEYGQHLDLSTRREWGKIQGRFEDIAFIEPAEQVVRMIAQAIRWNTDSTKIIPHRVMRSLATDAIQVGVPPQNLRNPDFEKIAEAAYPFHPVTLVTLPFVFRRFAQNERSMFSYLSSLEPFGFQEFIQNRTVSSDAPPLIRLVDLYDYFIKNLGPGLYRHPHALRWLEAADVLDRKQDLSKLHQDIVKTTGILNALGEFCHLQATEEMITFAVSDRASPDTAIQTAINELRELSVLTYRKFNRTYRIWEGSDVDIEARIAEGERKIRHGLRLADSIRQYLPKRPLFARRHSFETGALRFFELDYLDDPESMGTRLEPSSADGKILVCLAESTQTAERFREIAMRKQGKPAVVFAIPQLIGELRAVVTELGALRWAWDNTPELRDDRVARREMSLRIADADQSLRCSLDGLLDPRDEPVGSGCLWIHAGESKTVRSPVEVAKLLSDVCDQIYDKAPIIRNELITRRSLSSAAAAARRTLVERMLRHAAEEALGIQGYPPERSMYESVLRSTELHRKDADGSWGFSPPGCSDPKQMKAVWDFLCDAVFNRQPEPIPLVDLFAKIAAPPYGILAGLHPVLLCAFMLAHPDETTLYREGTFLPEPGIADFEVLMRRPDLFAVAGSRMVGERAVVVQRLAKGLNVHAATVSVVRALFGRVKRLPEFAWNTRRLPDTTQALRESFRSAKSPEQFLFVLLPEALGLPAFSEQRLQQRDVDRFFDALNDNLRHWAEASPQAISGARDAILEACGLSAGEAAWTELRHLAVNLEPFISEPQLLAFVQRVARSGADPTGIESVLGLVATRPPQSWHDSDVERFPAAATAVGRAFRGAVRAARLGGGAEEPLPNLTSLEREQADELAQQLRDYLQRTAAEATPRAIHAAMMRLIQELES